MATRIPCGLCTHLAQLFPGKLDACPVSNPPDLQRDAWFTITPPEPIPNEKVYDAVMTYYRSAGLEIRDDGHGIFCITVGELPVFQITVTNNLMDCRRMTVSAIPI